MPAIDRANRRARRDLAWVLGLTALCFALSLHFELHERYYRVLERYERWQADELPLSLLVLASGMAWFAFRRRREAQGALQQREHARAEAAQLLQRNRGLAQGLLDLQEKERAQIARELHDEMGQLCTALRMETSFLRHCPPGDEAGMRAAAERADGEAHALYQAVRGLLNRLRPAQLDTLGLVAALQALCEGWQQRSGVRCVLRHKLGAQFQADDATAMAVYRIAQEALTNVMRHAQATQVELHLRTRADDRLALSVRDDGRGQREDSGGGHGLGLLGASERAAALGGQLAWHSPAGGGFVLELQLPLGQP